MKKTPKLDFSPRSVADIRKYLGVKSPLRTKLFAHSKVKETEQVLGLDTLKYISPSGSPFESIISNCVPTSSSKPNTNTNSRKLSVTQITKPIIKQVSSSDSAKTTPVREVNTDNLVTVTPRTEEAAVKGLLSINCESVNSCFNNKGQTVEDQRSVNAPDASVVSGEPISCNITRNLTHSPTTNWADMAGKEQTTPVPEIVPEISINQIETDESEIVRLENKLKLLGDGSMEAMLLEIKIDMKKESLKTRRYIKSTLDVTSTLQTDVTTLKSDHAALEKRVSDLQTSHNTDSSTLKGTARDLVMVSEKLDLLANLCARQANEVRQVRSKAEQDEAYANRHKLYISGIEENRDEDVTENVNETITKFFEHQMKIRKKIEIQAAVRIAGADPRTIMVTLLNIKDKGAVYKHSKNLKGLKNGKDNGYYVNDHLPAGLQEIHRRHRDIIRANNNPNITPPDQKFTMKIKKGKLMIDSTLYKKKVCVPTYNQLTAPENMKNIDKVILTEGEEIKYGNCTFYGLSQEVKSIEDVRNGYIKAFKKHISSTHLVCVFSLPGREKHFLQDYVDDDDHTVGRSLLSLLTKNNITNRAVFVARYYGGSNLGPPRFDAYRDAARSAIACSSFNTITKQNQFVAS